MLQFTCFVFQGDQQKNTQQAGNSSHHRREKEALVQNATQL